MPGQHSDREPTQREHDSPAVHREPPAGDQRRLLELELIKVRSEAAAARLEARAAELELMIRQMTAGESKQADEVSSLKQPIEQASGQQSGQQSEQREGEIDAQKLETNARASELTPHSPLHRSNRSTSRPRVFDENASEPPPSAHQPSPIRFTSWDALRSASIDTAPRPLKHSPTKLTDASSAGSNPIEDHSILRIDKAAPTNAAPHIAVHQETDLDRDAAISQQADSETADLVSRRIDPPASSGRNARSVHDRTTSSSPAAVLIAPENDTETIDVVSKEVSVESDCVDEDDIQRSRRKPAAWLLSTFAHVAILLLLAACTLTSRTPKDQVALTASVSDPTEEVMETFEFESTEPVAEESQPTEAEVEYDISPIGEMSVAEMSPDAAPAPPTPNISDMLNPSQMSSASMSLKPKSETVTKFCGVEGGGNHFVYLVDSSGSMGKAFESARAELLRAVDSLKPDQKFYVVFFDAESDYMRLSDPNIDESGSVKATLENKQALRRWAMRISMDRGRAPYDPLKFALKLRPDVIFLLSDGEFPQGIEDLLAENNHIDNLFGDEDLISIVHTIGYYSREGESRMKRIAAQNKGQYRHIPKP